MASTKPTKTARWATDANRTLEPAAGEKNVGWEVNKKPPARKMNWLFNTIYTWFRWFDERFFDGATSEDLTIKPPTPAGAGGDLILKGSDATAGVGGLGELFGGDGQGAGAGGGAAFGGGIGGATGDGGATISFGGSAGATSGIGGTYTVGGGTSVGTDKDGPLASFRSGRATGDGSANADLRAVDASQGGGAALRSPDPYVTADGANKKITNHRTTDLTPTDATRGAAQIIGAAADPSVLTAGALSMLTPTGQAASNDGSVIQNLNTRVLSTIIDSDPIGNTAVETVFKEAASDIKYTIPADTLRVGSVIRVRGHADFACNGGDLFIGIRFGGVGGAKVFSGGKTLIGGGKLFFDAAITIRAIGAGGSAFANGFSFFDEFPIVGTFLVVSSIPAPVAVAFNAPQDLVVTGRWAVADAADVVTLYTLTVDIQ